MVWGWWVKKEVDHLHLQSGEYACYDQHKNNFRILFCKNYLFHATIISALLLLILVFKIPYYCCACLNGDSFISGIFQISVPCFQFISASRNILNLVCSVFAYDCIVGVFCHKYEAVHELMLIAFYFHSVRSLFEFDLFAYFAVLSRLADINLGFLGSSNDGVGVDVMGYGIGIDCGEFSLICHYGEKWQKFASFLVDGGIFFLFWPSFSLFYLT